MKLCPSLTGSPKLAIFTLGERTSFPSDLEYNNQADHTLLKEIEFLIRSVQGTSIDWR